jgi:hypothetical protein
LTKSKEPTKVEQSGFLLGLNNQFGAIDFQWRFGRVMMSGGYITDFLDMIIDGNILTSGSGTNHRKIK